MCVCVCVCVCLSAHNHIFGTTSPILTSFCACYLYGRGSVLICPQRTRRDAVCMRVILCDPRKLQHRLSRSRCYVGPKKPRTLVLDGVRMLQRAGDSLGDIYPTPLDSERDRRRPDTTNGTQQGHYSAAMRTVATITAATCSHRCRSCRRIFGAVSCSATACSVVGPRLCTITSPVCTPQFVIVVITALLMLLVQCALSCLHSCHLPSYAVCIITPIRERSTAMSVSVCVCVCVFVCPRSYLRNYTSDLHQNCCACYLWPWLSSPLAA